MGTLTNKLKLIVPALSDVIDDTLNDLGVSFQALDDILADQTTTVSGEQIDTGNSSATNFTGSLANAPVVRRTISITDGTETFTDTDGDGTLTGDAGGTGTLNHVTGAYDITFAAAPGAVAITADYNYVSIGSGSGGSDELPATTGHSGHLLRVKTDGSGDVEWFDGGNSGQYDVGTTPGTLVLMEQIDRRYAGRRHAVSNEAEDWYAYIATMPADSTSNHCKLLLDVHGSGWSGSDGLNNDTIFATNRGGLKVQFTRRNVGAPAKLQVQAYEQGDGTVDWYLRVPANTYTEGWTRCLGAALEGETDPVDGPVEVYRGDFTTTLPSGTKVWDSQTATPTGLIEVADTTSTDSGYAVANRNTVDAMISAAGAGGAGLGTWQAATLQNGWSHVTGLDVAFNKYANEQVVLRGSATGGSTGTVITTLPTGYRPAVKRNFLVVANDGNFGHIIMRTNGEVYLYSGSTVYVDLCQIKFPNGG